MKLFYSKYLFSMAIIGAALTLASCGQSDKTATDANKPAANTEVVVAAGDFVAAPLLLLVVLLLVDARGIDTA